MDIRNTAHLAAPTIMHGQKCLDDASWAQHCAYLARGEAGDAEKLAGDAIRGGDAEEAVAQLLTADKAGNDEEVEWTASARLYEEGDHALQPWASHAWEAGLI